MTPRGRKIVVYGLIILAVLLLGWLAASKMASSIDYHNNDFFTFYLAGWMNWQGQDPYSIEQWSAGHQHFNVTWMVLPVFPYPLPLATFLAPLGLLDLYSAFVAWIVVSGVLIILTGTCLLTELKTTYRTAYLLPLLAGAFLFRPTLVTFRTGQLGALWLFLIGCTIILWRKGAWFSGGLVLGMISLKPTLGFPILILVGLWLLFREHFEGLIGLVTSGITLLLIGLIRDPNWPTDYLTLSDRNLINLFSITPTIWGISGAICQYKEQCTWLLGGLFSAGLFIMIGLILWVWRKDFNPLTVLGITSAATVVSTPYILVYDQILVLVTVIASVVLLTQSGFPYIITASYPILVSALSVTLTLAALRGWGDHLSALVPLMCLVVLIVTFKGQRLQRGYRE